MFYQHQSEDYRPLFWMNGRPVYANTLVLGFHIVAFIVSALLISWLGLPAVYAALALIPSEIWHGEVWRLFSYVAFDPYFFQQRSLWFLWNMILLYFFGREVEQYIGRKNYFLLYAALIFVPAILLALAGLYFPTSYLNCCDVFFGMFVAFATLYPGAMPAFWIPLSMRALMWILLGLSTLIDLAMNAYTAIFMLWACTGTAYVAMRLVGAGRGLEWLTDWIEERRATKLARQHNIKVLEDKKATDSIDAILDKISKHGVGSLDTRERAALERARTDLLKRDQR